MKDLLLFISVIYSSCAVAQNPERINVNIKQIESEEQIVLKYDTVKNYVWEVSFPFEYEIRDQTPTGIWVRGASFYYTAEFLYRFTEPGWMGVPHMMKFDGKYRLRPDPMELKGKKYPNPTYYLVSSMHRIQEKSDIQDSLVQYIPEIKKTKDRTLSVGTLKEFKEKHPQLTERFLKGDSVSIEGYNKQTKYYEWINLPIEY